VVTSSPISAPAVGESAKVATDLLTALGSLPDPRRGGPRLAPAALRSGPWELINVITAGRLLTSRAG